MELFLSVYRFEKGLALRLGRPSGIRDTEIATSIMFNNHRANRSARIQGQVYDQLYSFNSSEDSEERGMLAKNLAEEVRGILKCIRSEITVRKALPSWSRDILMCCRSAWLQVWKIRCANSTFEGIWSVTLLCLL